MTKKKSETDVLWRKCGKGLGIRGDYNRNTSINMDEKDYYKKNSK